MQFWLLVVYQLPKGMLIATMFLMFKKVKMQQLVMEVMILNLLIIILTALRFCVLLTEAILKLL